MLKLTALTIFVLFALVLAVIVQAQQPDPSVDDCKAFPWKEPSKAPAMLPGMRLLRGQSIRSKEGALTLTTSGDLQLTRIRDGKLLWNTNTTTATQALFNGNLYLQDNIGNQIWSANITGNAGAILQVQHDCNLVIYGKAAYDTPVWSSGTNVCIKVHIIPHSHDDVGWILTPERYFDGCQSPGGGVEGVITTAIQCLLEDSTRTYTQVESYYFNRWWLKQNATTQATVKKLVQNGQLDLTNGGWSMHDEACVHQESAIANMEVGAQFLKEQFGDAMKLKIGWHIDPFGHASTTPRIMAQMGFDAFFFWRQDNQQRQYDMDRKGMETIWRSSTTLDGSYNMFTSILYQDYCLGCGPNGLDTTCPGAFCCFTCEVDEQQQAEINAKHTHGFSALDSFGAYKAHTPEEKIKLTEAMKKRAEREAAEKKTPAMHHRKNSQSLLDAFAEHFGKIEYGKTHTDVDRISKLLGVRAREGQALSLGYLSDAYAQMVRGYAGTFRTNHVLIPWGCDFRHDFAYEDYPIMDQIIKNINADNAKYGMEIFYSTPRRYVNTLAEEFPNDVWPENNDDYFVYADNDHAMWSGYFTSRAEYKGYERWLMANHRAAETVYSLNSSATPWQAAYDALYEYRQALGIAQHHDSITGTERTHVRNRYQFLLDRAYSGAQQIFQDRIQADVGLQTKACPLANLSVCAETTALATGKPVEIVLWNNIGHSRSEVLTVPIPTQNVEVMEVGTGSTLESQTVDVWRLTTTLDETSPQTTPAHKYQVYFAVDMAPWSFKVVRIIPSASGTYVPTSSTFVPTITNEYYNLTFDVNTNKVSGVTNRVTQQNTAFEQMVAHYCPHDNSYTDGSNQASGAYIFRTCTPTEDPIDYIPAGTKVPSQWVIGPLCSEVRQVISNSSNIQQAWRLCKGFDYVELTNGLGELDAGQNGVEVIQRLSVNGIKNSETWYTDSEGLELQKRVRNTRPNYPYVVNENIASNFFPCNAFATVNDTSAGSSAVLNMGIVMDRSRAMASLHEGQLEMLIHRRLLYDDGRGVGQALDSRVRVLSTSRLIFHEPAATFMEKVRLHSLRHTHYPLWFASTSSSVNDKVLKIEHHSHGKKQLAPAASIPLRGRATDPLPPNVHLHALTKLWDGVSMIVRLQHLFDRGEGQLATPAVVSLMNILPRDITSNPTGYSITETDLLGVNPLATMGRKPFNSCQKDGKSYTLPPNQDYVGAPKDVTGQVTLRPMEIRTFVVKKL